MPEEQRLKLPKGITMFPREQMCPKFRLIITFAYEFWLKCFQLQSCSPPRDLSNDRSQAYIKTNMKWLWLQKYSEHIFYRGTWAFPQRKYIIPPSKVPFSTRNLGPSPRKLHCSLRKLPFSQGTFLTPWGTYLGLALSLLLLEEVTS